MKRIIALCAAFIAAFGPQPVTYQTFDGRTMVGSGPSRASQALALALARVGHIPFVSRIGDFYRRWSVTAFVTAGALFVLAMFIVWAVNGFDGLESEPNRCAPVAAAAANARYEGDRLKLERAAESCYEWLTDAHR